MAKSDLDLSDKSFEDLDAIEAAVIEARKRKTSEEQNELINQYQKLRKKMIRLGMVEEEQLPVLKIRGWTRKTSKIK